MNIVLGNLKEGDYRHVEGKEYAELQKLIAHSKNMPVIPKKEI